MSASLNPGFNPFSSGSSASPLTATSPKVGVSSAETQLDMNQLVARIDKKIAELEEEERKKSDASKLNQVIDRIKERRDGLYQADLTDFTDE